MTGCLPLTPLLGIKPTMQVCVLTRNRTHNLLVYGTMLQQIEPPGKGYSCYLSIFTMVFIMWQALCSAPHVIYDLIQFSQQPHEVGALDMAFDRPENQVRPVSLHSGLSKRLLTANPGAPWVPCLDCPTITKTRTCFCTW